MRLVGQASAGAVLEMTETRLEKSDAVDQNRHRVGDWIGNKVMLEIDASARPRPSPRLTHEPPGNPDDSRLWRNILDDDRIGPDTRVSADRNIAENLRPGADHHTVLHGRMPLAWRPGRSAERDAVIESDIVADDRGFADHHARAMIDEETLADHRARMDVDIGQKPRDERNGPGEEFIIGGPKPVREPMPD